MEAPVTRTTLHSFDRHRQSLQKEDQGDPSVIQEIRMHPASPCARTGKQKSKRDRAKESENESVLYVTLFLSAFFHLIQVGLRERRSSRSALVNVIWDRIFLILTTSCGGVHSCDSASPLPPFPGHRQQSCRESDDAHD